MAPFVNNEDITSCPHCGNPVRSGMIRCRECGKMLAEADDEFVLAPQIAAAVQAQAKCARCGMLLEPGIDDCPNCASAMLDDLMKGPAVSAAPPVPQAESAAAPPKPRRSQPPQKPSGPAKSKASAKSHSSMEDDPPGLFDVDDAATTPPSAEPPRTDRAKSPVAAEKGSLADSAVDTSAACSALLASLATGDSNLRIEIAAALGKLGDKAAMGPLETHLVDQDVRVRRAVAAALAQLGHPKGEALLNIAERKPAAAVLSTSKATAAPRPKPKPSGGGMSIDGGTMKKLGVAVVAIAVVGGGVWYWMNSGSTGSARKSRKPKSKTTKKVSAAAMPAPSVALREWHATR
jgi:hypothetical protein